MRQKTDKLTDTMKLLEDGVTAVFDSDRYKEFLSVMSKFHHYSVNNQILIMMQMPTATNIAGYHKWHVFNRYVRKNSHGLRIICPMPYKTTNADGKEETNIRYRVGYVYDISQTEGEPLPELASELTGTDAAYQNLIPVLQAIASCPVIFSVDLPAGAYGCYSLTENLIRIRSGIAPQQACKTIIHEVVHSLLDNDKNDKTTDRQTRECRAESVAYVVCHHLQIDTSDYSFPYIAGWSSSREAKELKAELNTIHDTAQALLLKIDEALLKGRETC